MSVRRIRVSGEILNLLLRSSEMWISRLPDDVNVIDVAGEDRRTHTFVLLVESQQFPPIPEGRLIPFIDHWLTRKRPPS